jgi:hypothetical protein
MFPSYCTRISTVLLTVGVVLGPSVASAELPDEIQVYTDDLDAPGEAGVELHVNTTPSGRSRPDFPGEVTPRHAVRITPEFSYGLTRTLEAGLYLPTVRAADGDYQLAGAKLRLKWVPVRPGGEDAPGFFAGLNGELGRIDRKYEEGRTGYEVRTILGWRGEAWLLAANPIFTGALSADTSRKTNGTLALKVARRAMEGLAVGLEYYADYGPLSDPLPHDRQAHTLFAVFDYDRKGYGLNFGVGYGLGGAADRWTVKAILEIPLFR